MSRRFLLTLGALSLSVFLIAPLAYAADATLFLSPVTGTYITGDAFTVSVSVDSGGAVVNAIEGKLEYDPKELTVLSVDASSSVITSWVSAPAFDSDTGIISFSGSLATGTVLSRATVLKFQVKGERSGEFRVRFVSGAAILAADGTGGNIVSALNNGVYEIVPSVNDPQTVPPSIESDNADGEVLGAATGTAITSSTHPDQSLWYALATSSLAWDLPSGLSDIRLSLDKKPNGVGTVSYPASVHGKTVTQIHDGINYFHVTRDYTDGESATANYTLKIDTVSPTNLSVTEVPRSDPTDPHVLVNVTATDTLSGIDHYEFMIDGGAPSTWVDTGNHQYTVPIVGFGDHKLSVVAVDKAGNRSSETLDYKIDNLPTPAITLIKSTLSEEEKLKLSVVSVPGATLEIALQKGDSSPVTEEYTVDAGGRGEFVSALSLVPGEYIISATAHSAAGGISNKSEGQTVEVSASMMGIVKRHPLVPVAAIGLVLLSVFSWYFFRRRRNTDQSDTEEEREIVYEDEPFEEEVINREPLPRANVSQKQFTGGAVVLEKRKKVEMPFTRL